MKKSLTPVHHYQTTFADQIHDNSFYREKGRQLSEYNHDINANKILEKERHKIDKLGRKVRHRET